MAEKECAKAAADNTYFKDRSGKPFTGSQAYNNRYATGRNLGGEKQPFVLWTKAELDKRDENKKKELAKRAEVFVDLKARYPAMQPDPL